MGIRVGDEIKGYPHPVLDWHEIVNDDIGDVSFALTYCPLTGTGIGWDRNINGRNTTFGVSGLLFETNLMPFDRETESIWSQQRLECVNGELSGQKAQLHSLVEMSWESWKAAFPNSQVLNTDTGFSRNYNRYPYGDYRLNNSAFLFPISRTDNRLPAKERVLGVRIGESFKAYPFDITNAGLEVIFDTHAGTDLLVARHTRRNFIVAFSNIAADSFIALGEEEFPLIIADQNGVKYDVLGFPEGGGAPLTLSEQFIGYWFSWGTFYPDLPLFEG